MSKELKIISGTNVFSSPTTVYTVPSGRVARIEVNYFSITGSGSGSLSQNSYIGLGIGNYSIAVRNNMGDFINYNLGIKYFELIATQNYSNAFPVSLHFSSLVNDPTTLSVPEFHYLTQNQTIVLTNSTGNSATAKWAFAVIEEY